MAVRIQFRRGTAAEWTSANPTLAAGELGYETDTAKFKLGDGSTVWASLNYAGINQSDIDAAVANVVDSAPAALDTLNELAAALGNDASFATSITNNLANKISLETDSLANYTSANAVTDSGTAYINSDDTSFVKIGDGSSNWGDILYVGSTYTLDAISAHGSETENVHGISNAMEIVYTAELSQHTDATENVHGIANVADLLVTADLTAHNDDTTNVHGIADTSVLETSTGAQAKADAAETAANEYTDDEIIAHAAVTENVHGIANTLALITAADAQTQADAAEDAANEYTDNAISNHSVDSTNVHGIANTADLVVTSDLSVYALLAGPTFTGNVELPATTDIGNVTGTEIGYLEGTTSAIQDQLDAKLDTSSAASIYAPIASPDFTGNVIFTNAESLTIPANSNFDIAGLDGMQISSYLADIDRNVKQRLDNAFYYDESTDPLPMIGIGNVTYTQLSTLDGVDTDNVYSTQLNYLAGLTGSIQAQLDAKAALAGATFTGDVEAQDVTITGNLVVQGTTTTVSASDLKVKDNMIYLNQAGLSTLTGAVGDGTNVVYTTAEAHGYDVGDDVTVANTTPSSLNIASPGYSIIAVTDTTFTVASNVTDTYVSGGTARGKVHSNPDLGWAAGRYDTVNGNGYAHAGIFRDASDGVFKFFDGYVPEPDESVFIDTTDNTFALAPLQVASLTAANVIATTGVIFPDNTIQTSAGVASLTGFTEKTASYTLDTLDHKDNVVEMNSGSALTFTIPTNATLAWPVGASMDIIQTGAGQVTIANAVGVTLNYTPGNKLRTQWSSCTIMKRATDSWIVYGDLTA